jgi:hypothetical protein
LPDYPVVEEMPVNGANPSVDFERFHKLYLSGVCHDEILIVVAAYPCDRSVHG